MAKLVVTVDTETKELVVKLNDETLDGVSSIRIVPYDESNYIHQKMFYVYLQDISDKVEKCTTIMANDKYGVVAKETTSRIKKSKNEAADSVANFLRTNN